MQLLAVSTFAILVGLVAGDAPCPTVTTTAESCSTCVVLACLAISTVHVPSGCAVATATASYPCAEGRCPSGCASTSYVYVPGQPTATNAPACNPS